ncbi:T9SS type A sorting domain-containing protein [Pontibacter sp. HSC-14F20]|uniref:Ig-like domain-containing protein n=1 Tax=Pontibacter sp. HSC-14F20 TaxID=2864136 RepID=UPI001C72D62F|nr:T9SS type A sorting domain-containing protein [Pontibacter sp. HSC-14F20]MBX0333647.1 T9SS type A sorting domain-containing protein [Pontibacter sp. HSC-14F20]
MKHIYNLIHAGIANQSVDKVLGIAWKGKSLTTFIFTSIFYFLIIAASAQTKTIYDNKFDGTYNNHVSSENLTVGNASISNERLTVQGQGFDIFIYWQYEYSGFIDLNPSLTLQEGYEYQVAVKARTSGVNGRLRIRKGTSAAAARNATGGNRILNPSNNNVPVSSGYTTFTSSKFRVTSQQPLYLSLLVNRLAIYSSPISMILDDLIVTRTCITPSIPTVQNRTVTSCNASVQLSATGNLSSWEQYKWYDPDGNVISGQTGATYTANRPGTYRVTKVNTASECSVESAPVTIQVTLNPPFAPTVGDTKVISCVNNEATLTASGATASQSYRWYTQPTGGTAIAGANGATYSTSIAGKYYVAIVNGTNCESARVETEVEILDWQDALTEIIYPTLEAGESATLTLNSALRDNNLIAEYKWSISVNGSAFASIGENSYELNLAVVPNGDVVFQCVLIPNGSYCYTENSFIATTESITPLPVELMFFKAQAQTQGVSLTWATASELENKGFEVQVSNNGREFKEIGFVESKVGTTSLRQDYNFLDTKAVSGTRYYRLKQMDFDGTTSYSPIRAVALDAGNGTVSVYPNPFDDAVIVTLNGTEARNVQVVLMDAMGKVLQQRTEETSGNSITVDMRSVRTKGIYILHVLDNDTKYTFKLMKR